MLEGTSAVQGGGSSQQPAQPCAMPTPQARTRVGLPALRLTQRQRVCLAALQVTVVLLWGSGQLCGRQV